MILDRKGFLTKLCCRGSYLNLYWVLVGCLLAACQQDVSGNAANQHSAHAESETQADKVKTLRPRTCDYFDSDYLDVDCYYFFTDSKGGYRLPVVVLSPKHQSQSDDILVYVPGGPGQGNMTKRQEVEYWVHWMEDNEIQTDFLLYDPRGVKGTVPEASCGQYNVVVERLLGETLSMKAEISALNNVAAKCYREFVAKHKAHLSSHNEYQGIFSLASKAQALDVVNIPRALDYKNVHIWGTSYGTRLALIASQDKSVRSLLLDSLYPLDKGKYSEWIRLYRKSFELHQSLWPHFIEKSEQLYMAAYKKSLSKMSDGAIKVEVENWAKPEKSKTEFYLNSIRMLELSFSVLYSPHLYQKYYEGLLTFSETGKISSDFAWVIEYFVNTVLDPSFSPLVYFAVECLDNQKENAKTMDFSFYDIHEYSEYFRLGAESPLCKQMAVDASQNVNSLIHTIKPTLLFSGKYDPVTPIEWAEKYSAQSPLIKHTIFERSSHAALLNMDCDWSFIDKFVSQPYDDISVVCKGGATWQ